MSPKRWKQPPRGVVDTSVLIAGVSGFREEPTENPSAALLAAWTEVPTVVWLLTHEILTEYLEVLQRMHVRGASTIVALIRDEGQFVRTTEKIAGLPDPDDVPFCECAESGNADFIVTLNPDPQLLQVGRRALLPEHGHTMTERVQPHMRNAEPHQERLENAVRICASLKGVPFRVSNSAGEQHEQRVVASWRRPDDLADASGVSISLPIAGGGSPTLHEPCLLPFPVRVGA